MNTTPIDSARDRDLRLSAQALHRAAQRARELAARTGTALVILRDGAIVHVEHAGPTGAAVREAQVPYGEAP